MDSYFQDVASPFDDFISTKLRRDQLLLLAHLLSIHVRDKVRHGHGITVSQMERILDVACMVHNPFVKYV